MDSEGKPSGYGNGFINVGFAENLNKNFKKYKNS